jgi:mannosyl-3-phosphoglycerate phosphatase
MSLVIFTDLDGTLLDRDSYSWQPARSALDYCRQCRVPVVAATSKTLAETREISRKIGLDPRFIFENGGGIFLGDGAWLSLGIPYEQLRNEFSILADRFSLRGMGDMDVAELVEITGLTPREAGLAKQRLFSEPFLYAGNKLPELKTAAAERGLQVLRGGRFYHLMAAQQSKGNAVREWICRLGENMPRPFFTAALGDSPNDFSMLAVVDFPFLVRQKDGGEVKCPLKTAVRSQAAGPAGWSEAVMGLLTDQPDIWGLNKEKNNV